MLNLSQFLSLELIQAIPFSFAALFPVLNPIGSSVIFLTLVNGASPRQIKTLATLIPIYTFVMLTIVLFAGAWILRAFGISIPIVLIGGGLILANIGWQLLNRPSSNPDKEVNPEDLDKNFTQMAFFPLTMPVTAGPGCIAVTITIGAHSFTKAQWIGDIGSQLGATIGILLVCIIIFFCYRYAQAIILRLGQSGMQVIMRLAAFLNLCIGLEIVWRGVSLLLASNT